jgi:acetylornithine aminotransferase
VLRSQSSKLLHTSNVYYNEPSAALASLLVTLTQREGGLGYPTGSQHARGIPGAKVFFSNSGTEANEGALKVARKVGKDRGGPAKTEIVCFQQSFHGRSLGALSVTSNSKYQDPFMPLLPGIRVGELNRSEGLKDLITENTCAVIVEPIQGEGGVNCANVQWIGKLVQRARDAGAVVIFDEIQVSDRFNSEIKDINRTFRVGDTVNAPMISANLRRDSCSAPSDILPLPAARNRNYLTNDLRTVRIIQSGVPVGTF